MRTLAGKKLWCKACPFWKRCKHVDLVDAPKRYCEVEDVNGSWVVVRYADGSVLTFHARVIRGGLGRAGSEDVTLTQDKANRRR